jgi:hypothetical protein
MCIGLAQWGFVSEHTDGCLLWIAANLIGGALCAFFSLPLTLTGSLIGSALMGSITGWMLLRLVSHVYDD